jgi:hypothetical protein
MRRFLALTCACWMAWCGARSNTAPLAFGMTRQEAAAAFGAPLVPVPGRRGAERYVAEVPASVPGFYPVTRRTVLQFRRGRLTGWKNDWAVHTGGWPWAPR